MERNVMSGQEYKKIIQNLVVPEAFSDEEKQKRYQPLKDYLKENIPNKLFRFRGCKERAFDEFDKDKLGFAPAAEMNDDFDGMLYFNNKLIMSSFTGSEIQQTINKIVESAKIGAIPDEIKKVIPEESFQQFIIALSSLPPETINIFTNQFINFAIEEYDQRVQLISQIVQNQKIACLSQKIESAAMWGYYAANGTGFALSYDLREPNFSEYCIAPVIYGDARLDATEYVKWIYQHLLLQRIFISVNAYEKYSSIKHLIPCPDEFMCTKVLIYKASVWKHEKEWRLIYNEKKGQDNTYPNITKKPSAVYLGRNISPIHEKKLRCIAEEKNIPVYKMTIKKDNHTYNLYPQMQ